METDRENRITRWFEGHGLPLRLLRSDDGRQEVAGVTAAAGPPRSDARRVGIVGSRGYPDVDFVRRYVRKMAAASTGARPIAIVGGTEPPPEGVKRNRPDGVDEVSIREARAAGLETVVHAALWQVPGGINNRAGVERNTIIVEDSDDVVAFWDLESTGTADSILKAARRGNLRAVYGPDTVKLSLHEAERLAVQARNRHT